VTVLGVLDHYVNRPLELENVSLASYVAWYNYYKTKPTNNSKSKENPGDSDVEDFNDECTASPEEDKYLELLNNDGFIRKRTISKIIRYRRFNRLTEQDEWFREQIMLFFPYRDEDTDILNKNFENFYHIHIKTIEENKKEFDPLGLDHILEDWHDAMEEEEEIVEPAVVFDEQYSVHYEGESCAGGFKKKGDSTKPSKVIIPPTIADEQYLENTRNLNEGQQVNWF